jgi:uncharacterized membrane protein
MSVRLSEIHPALVHFPIALLPTAIAADAVGVATRNRELLAVGKWAIAGAAVSAGVAGVFGFIAQEEVSASGKAERVLQTHRTLNIMALGVVTTMALVRATKRRPGIGYVLAGLGAIATVGFSAYLGGKLVYAHGAGVSKADGIFGSDPELSAKTAGRFVATAAKDLGTGIVHTARDVAHGKIVPAIRERAG